ncbi:hypothetical protein CANINC_000550 [Pichia inconspicua]|uniref:Mediator of RNA polymerase II transcription subunit 31 n=1 Tax=Pichia inconspicua TaxID=52247 RepID=A0A4T0X5W1_9ASCO|nr:hypothetical protein CANINC_000550 [[Candida] inconspicua]
MTEIPLEDIPTRWEIELEFVQSLANTQYLVYLAQQGYFKDPTFLNYLNYLNYWKDPKYSVFLVYPDCLHILTLLQSEQFRNELLNQNLTNMLYSDMVDYWKESLFKIENEKNQFDTNNQNQISNLQIQQNSPELKTSSSPDVIQESTA